MVSQPVLPIDYTNLGYDSLREAMLSLARASLPEWTDFSENDLGVLLVELFAYANDITLYYQTRIAGNLFPATSDEPDALVQLLRLIGYELRPPAPATAELRIAFQSSDLTAAAPALPSPTVPPSPIVPPPPVPITSTTSTTSSTSTTDIAKNTTSTSTTTSTSSTSITPTGATTSANSTTSSPLATTTTSSTSTTSTTLPPPPSPPPAPSSPAGPANPPILIPGRTSFSVSLSTGEQLIYETEQDLQILPGTLTQPDAAGLQYFNPIPVVQGQTVQDEPVAASDGSPNQMYTLQNKPVIADSISVTVIEANGDKTYWQAVNSLANSSPADRHFSVQRDAEGAATIIFGDGSNGLIPPASNAPGKPTNINATYRVGGGPQGNVPANTVFTPIGNAKVGTINVSISKALNISAAAGGSSGEDIRRASSFAPHLFRTQERAVTLQDYIDLALQVPGVGKALAVALNWNQVVLYIAPTGQVADPSELLIRDILSFFESRRMASITIKICGPVPADIYLGATIRAQPHYLQSDVRAAVEQAVADYLAFDAVDFGQQIYLSKIYDVIQNLPQVASLTVFKFSRKPAVTPGQQDVDTDGIIELAPHELPRPGYRDDPEPTHAPDPTNPIYRPSIFTIIQGGVVPGGVLQ